MADLRTVLRIIAKDETGSAITKTRGELKGLSTSLAAIRNQVLALAGINFGVGGVAQLIAVADGYQLVTSRLKLLSGETENFAAVQNEVFEIAQRTFTSYEQAAAIYGNLAESTRELGLESEQLLTITEALTQSYQISGSTQQEAKASTIQLVQALASGQLRGQEFNSVAEQGRRILIALKDATGLSAGELRNFANNGKLTTEFFVNSFLPQAEKIREEFKQMPLTVARSLTQLSNAFERYVGEQNQSLGITRDIADVFADLAQNFDQFAEVVLTSGALAVSFITQRFIAALGLATSQRLAETKQQLAVIAAGKAEAASRLKNAEAAAAQAAASEARIAALIAEERATLASATQLGIAGGQRVALERTINQLQLQHVAATQARVAADAAVVTATNAVTAATLRATIATRAWNTTLAFLGGPIGIAITALGALGYAIYAFNDSTESGTDAYNDFVDTLEKGKTATDAQKSSVDDLGSALDKLKFSQQFAEIAAGEQAVRRLKDEIANLEQSLQFGDANIVDPISGLAGPGDFEYLEGLKVKSEDAQEQVDRLKAQLEELVRREKELAGELDRDVTGVPKTLKDAVKQQQDANNTLASIENRRRKLIDALDEQSERLAGPNLDDVEEQTTSFNIASLNTLRGTIQDQISANDPKAAIASLERAKEIVDYLQQEGNVSRGYLKTQVDLVRKLAEEAGDIQTAEPEAKVKVGLEVDPDQVRQEAENLAKAVNPVLEALGFEARLRVTSPDDAEISRKSAEYAALFQQALDQNPGIQPVVVENDQAVQALLAARAAMQAAADENPVVQPVVTGSASTDLDPGPRRSYAGGGRLAGPGTDTSDSILAWLSNNEFVVRASAAKHYGYDFLYALNNLRIPRFAAGGMVGVRAPGVSMGAPLTLNIGGETAQVVVSGPGVMDLRRIIKRENAKRGSRV